MGYYTRVTGAILIDPPLDAAELRRLSRISDDDRGARVQVEITEVETEEGTLLRQSGTAIVPARDEAFKAYDLVDAIQDIVSAFPDRRFAGLLECAGEESGDLWRVVIRNGRATEIRPTLTWPNEEEEAS